MNCNSFGKWVKSLCNPVVDSKTYLKPLNLVPSANRENIAKNFAQVAKKVGFACDTNQISKSENIIAWDVCANIFWPKGRSSSSCLFCAYYSTWTCQHRIVVVVVAFFGERKKDTTGRIFYVQNIWLSWGMAKIQISWNGILSRNTTTRYTHTLLHNPFYNHQHQGYV